MAKRKYRVTSRANTLGRPRGTVFSEDLPKDFEAQLIARGALERVKGGEKESEPEPPKRPDIAGVKGSVKESS